MNWACKILVGRRLPSCEAVSEWFTATQNRAEETDLRSRRDVVAPQVVSSRRYHARLALLLVLPIGILDHLHEMIPEDMRGRVQCICLSKSAEELTSDTATAPGE